MYIEASVVICGAVGMDLTFDEDEMVEMTPDEAVAQFIDGVEEMASMTPENVFEVFVLEHEHPQFADGSGCECVQYVQDHHPAATFND